MAVISQVALPKGQWVKVATDSPGGKMYKIKTTPSYLVKYVATGDPAPTDNTGAISFGLLSFSKIMDVTSPILGIDTYVKSRGLDGIIEVVEGVGGGGSVTIAAKDINTGLDASIMSVNGGILVADGLLEVGFINEYISRSTGNTSTIAAPASVGDRNITVASDVPFTVGELVKLSNGFIFEMVLFTVLAKPGGNVLTLDRPIDFDYIVGSLVDERSINLAVDGSVTPQVFEIAPPAGLKYELTRSINRMSFTSSSFTDVDFGDITNGLTRGVIVQGDVESVIFGTSTRTIANWKTNGDMKDDMYDVDDNPKAGPSLSGQKGRWTFTRAGVVFSLHGNQGHKGRVIIQDDLATNLADFRVKMQGKVFLTPP